MNVYEQCPVLQNDQFLLRLVEKEDCSDLLKVYSDSASVPLFNSDNCHGDTFYYQTMERMAQAIDFWIFSYHNRYFVRWSIIDRSVNQAIGTIELFQREGLDGMSVTGLLRLDLRSDYEREDVICHLLGLIEESVFEMFGCTSVTTKAAPFATVRRAALHQKGYEESTEEFTGDDGTRYGHYFVYRKSA